MPKKFIVSGFILIFILFNACSGKDKTLNDNAPRLFLDEIGSSLFFRSKRINQWNFQELEQNRESMPEEKTEDNAKRFSKSFVNLPDDTIIEANFSFPSYYIDKEGEIFNRSYFNFIRLAQHEFVKRFSKSSKLKKNGWEKVSILSGNWSFQGDVLQYRINKDNRYSDGILLIDSRSPDGIILDKSKKLINGAISVKFRIEDKNIGKPENDAIGILFNLSDEQTGTLFRLFKSGKMEYTSIEKGIKKYNYGVLPNFPPLTPGDHIFRFIFFNGSLAYNLDGSPFKWNKNTYQIKSQEGYVGVWLNTNIKIFDLDTFNPGGNTGFTGKNSERLNPSHFKLEFSDDNDKKYSIKINKNGPIELNPDVASQMNLAPGFHSKKDHTLNIINHKGIVRIMLDHILVKRFNNIDKLKIDPNGVIIEDVRIAKIKDQIDFNTLNNNIEETYYYEKIISNIIWKKDKKGFRGPDTGKYELNQDARGVALVNTPSEMKFPLKIEPASFLSFGIGLPKETWGKNDEIIFKIALIDDNKKEFVIFKEQVNTNKYAFRKWFDYRIDLSEYEGFNLPLPLWNVQLP